VALRLDERSKAQRHDGAAGEKANGFHRARIIVPRRSS
jgi:hypothetical protein